MTLPPASSCHLTNIATAAMHGNFEAAGRMDGFEGAEKRLEIDLKPEEGKSIRKAPRELWDKVMDAIHAKIVDKVSDDQIDAYLLTESSLFVHDYRVTLITCGTTKTLNALYIITEEIERQDMKVEWVMYSRKNFQYPWVQPSPHTSIGEEYETLHRCFPDGHPYVLGPLDADHYFLFMYDAIERPRLEHDQQLNIAMYDMDESVAKHFAAEEFTVDNAKTSIVRANTKLDSLVDGFVVQDMVFNPCGYSLNSIRNGEYYTIHVTPENHCSYASFETCARVPSFRPLIQQVLDVFKPRKFTVIILLDDASPCSQSQKKGEDIGECSIPGYQRIHCTVNEFEPGYRTIKCLWIKQGTGGSPLSRPAVQNNAA